MTKKRGNGEGSLYEHKRNGKKVGYRGSYTVCTATGPKRRYVPGKTREEVRQKLAKAIADRDGGLVCDVGGQRVGQYLQRWLESSVRGSVRASTHASYERQVARYIIPTIGRVKLGKLTPAHVQHLYRVICRIGDSQPALSNTPMPYYIAL